MFAIIRMNKLGSSDLGKVERHNLRLGQPEPNVDPSRTHLNRYLKLGNNDLRSSIMQRIKDAGVTRKVRPDAVLGIEFMMSASPDFFDEDMRNGKSAKLEEWLKDSVKYIQDLAGGEENIVQLVLHMDEKTPHIQGVFVPLSDDAPSKSSKPKTPGQLKLNAKPWTSPGKWQRMWTTYAAAMAKHGLRRGEFNVENEHQSLKAGREEVIQIAKRAEAKADQVEDHVHNTLAKHQAAIQRQETKIDLVVKQQVQIIQEQKTLIQSITAQLKQAHETIKRLLATRGTNAPQTPDQAAAGRQTDPFNPSMDDLGL